MDVEFDPAKDALNIDKHGISLGRASELSDGIVVKDDRFSEPRYRIYGLIDGLPHCAAVTLRNGVVRIISLRRSHEKEYKRYV